MRAITIGFGMVPIVSPNFFRVIPPEPRPTFGYLFGTEPPPHNRRYLKSRLAYRLQELMHGGLRPETVERLEAMGEKLDGGEPQVRRIRADNRPIAGTRLVRGHKGIEHVVTVLSDGFEWEGRPSRGGTASPRS